MASHGGSRCLEILHAARCPPLLLSHAGRAQPWGPTGYATSPLSGQIRPWQDKDVICRVIASCAYRQLGRQPRQRGFQEDSRPGAPHCSCCIADLVLDRRQPGAPAQLQGPQSGRSIRIVTAPVFLAAKLEAFRGRGQGIGSLRSVDCLAPMAAVIRPMAKRRRPVGGALAPACDHRLGIWGSIGSGVCGSRVACLGPGRKGMGITSGRRDARGLTFSVVITARVLQPGVSTRGKQKWRIALCCYGMAFAPRHQVHLLCVASLVHLRCAHRLG
jgi:hypothetical protein